MGKWAAHLAPNKMANEKLAVFGFLCNQIVLFGVLEIISAFNFDNKIALLIPYLDHRQEMQDSRGMLYLWVMMIVFFIVSGIVVVWLDRKRLFSSVNK